MREIFWDVDAEQGIGTVCYEALDLLRSMTDVRGSNLISFSYKVF